MLLFSKSSYEVIGRMLIEKSEEQPVNHQMIIECSDGGLVVDCPLPTRGLIER